MSTDFYIHQSIINAWSKQKRYTVAYGGRGSGKSLQFGALCIIEAINNPGSRILCVRGTQNKISESSLQVLKDIISMMGLDSYFNITENTLSAKNGSEFLFYGAKNYETFKSLQRINLVWVDEATELSGSAWQTLVPTIRADNSKFLISFNPNKKTDWVYNQFVINKHPEAVVILLNYADNPFFPKVLETEMLYDKSTNINKYNHVWLGQLKSLSEEALWKENQIIYLEEDEFDLAELEKIVVSIDPSVTDKQTSDACGLVVVGKYINQSKYIVLDDQTEILSPNAWTDRAIELYYKWGADRIIGETNQGGDLIKTLLLQKDNTIPFTGVHASRGKITRAEPIASLYEQGKVIHFKHFANLEYEMTTFSGKTTDKSPNSLDALVWGLTYLSQNKREVVPKGMVKINMQGFNF